MTGVVYGNTLKVDGKVYVGQLRGRLMKNGFSRGDVIFRRNMALSSI